MPAFASLDSQLTSVALNITDLDQVRVPAAAEGVPVQASAADVPTAPKTVNERLTPSCLDRLQLLEDVRSRVPSVAERRDDYLVTLGHKVIESSLEGIHIAVMAGRATTYDGLADGNLMQAQRGSLGSVDALGRHSGL